MIKLLLCCLLVIGMPTVVNAISGDENGGDGNTIIEDVENNEDENIGTEDGGDTETEEGEPAIPYDILCPQGECWV